jgi:hypothetical protein
MSIFTIAFPIRQPADAGLNLFPRQSLKLQTFSYLGANFCKQ